MVFTMIRIIIRIPQHSILRDLQKRINERGIRTRIFRLERDHEIALVIFLLQLNRKKNNFNFTIPKAQRSSFILLN